jgi:hypothetical protein
MPFWWYHCLHVFVCPVWSVSAAFEQVVTKSRQMKTEGEYLVWEKEEEKVLAIIVLAQIIKAANLFDFRHFSVMVVPEALTKGWFNTVRF